MLDISVLEDFEVLDEESILDNRTGIVITKHISEFPVDSINTDGDYETTYYPCVEYHLEKTINDYDDSFGTINKIFEKVIESEVKEDEQRN